MAIRIDIHFKLNNMLRNNIGFSIISYHNLLKITHTEMFFLCTNQKYITCSYNNACYVNTYLGKVSSFNFFYVFGIMYNSICTKLYNMQITFSISI